VPVRIGRPDGAYQQRVDDDEDDARQRCDEYHTEPVVHIEEDMRETLQGWVIFQHTPSSVVNLQIPGMLHFSNIDDKDDDDQDYDYDC